MAVSMEVMLELWSLALRDGRERLRPLFKHVSVADSAASYIDGLFGPERRKTGWMRAEAAGDAGPWRQQAVLGRSVWDADALREVVRECVLETLSSPDAVLVIDETGFLCPPGDAQRLAGQGLLWGCPPVHGLCGQDHQLPDWCVYCLYVRARARADRPPALSAEEPGR